MNQLREWEILLKTKFNDIHPILDLCETLTPLHNIENDVKFYVDKILFKNSKSHIDDKNKELLNKYIISFYLILQNTNIKLTVESFLTIVSESNVDWIIDNLDSLIESSNNNNWLLLTKWNKYSLKKTIKWDKKHTRIKRKRKERYWNDSWSNYKIKTPYKRADNTVY